MSSYIRLKDIMYVEVVNNASIISDPNKPSLTYSGSISKDSWFQQEWKAPTKAPLGKKKFWERN